MKFFQTFLLSMLVSELTANPLAVLQTKLTHSSQYLKTWDNLYLDSHEVSRRTKRDLRGIMDAIANGANGLRNGFAPMTKSVREAFNNIFSPNNLKSVRDGIQQFKQGLRNALGIVANNFRPANG